MTKARMWLLHLVLPLATLPGVCGACHREAVSPPPPPPPAVLTPPPDLDMGSEPPAPPAAPKPPEGGASGAATLLPPPLPPAGAAPSAPSADYAYPEIAKLIPAPASLERAAVSKVIDGDTIRLADGDKVRLIGINTPEHDEPLYAEATALLKALVGEREVGLATDVDGIDMYKRRLAYVFVDRRFVNGEMVRRGLAHVYRWEPNVKYASQLLELQRAARRDHLGMWALPPPPPSPVYYGGKREHLFHRPECPVARRLAPKDRIEFPTREAAFDAGRRAHQACSP